MSTRSPSRGDEPSPAPQPPPSAELVPTETYARIDAGPDFQNLRRTFRRFAFPMTALFLAWYLLYVFVSAWGREFMGTKLLGNINVGYVFGLLQFVSTFVIAWVYWRHANKNLDPVAGRIRAELEQEAIAAARRGATGTTPEAQR